MQITHIAYNGEIYVGAVYDETQNKTFMCYGTNKNSLNATQCDGGWQIEGKITKLIYGGRYFIALYASKNIQYSSDGVTWYHLNLYYGDTWNTILSVNNRIFVIYDWYYLCELKISNNSLITISTLEMFDDFIDAISIPSISEYPIILGYSEILAQNTGYTLAKYNGNGGWEALSEVPPPGDGDDFWDKAYYENGHIILTSKIEAEQE